MGKLDGALGYLSGPMEFVADHGVVWRRKFIKLSYNADLKIDFIDPTDKPGGEEVQIGENKEHQAMLQRTGQFKELKEYVGKYRHYDLRFTDYSDFLVVVVDPSIPQWGTANETYCAEFQHKPLFFICQGGLYKLPRWLFGPAELDMVFESVEDVIERLVHLDKGEIPLSDEWIIVRRHIEERRKLFNIFSLQESP